MPKKREVKKQEINLKETSEVSVEVGYIQENAVQNVSNIESYTVNTCSGFKNMGYRASYELVDKDGELEKHELNFTGENELEFELQYKDDAQFAKLFSLDDMKERLKKGESVGELCDDLKNYIMQNKDSNPDAIQRAIATLLGDAKGYYDKGTDNFLGISGFNREHLGNSAEEILDKVLNCDDEQLHGFVCSTISEFGMRLLDECDIKATLLCGGTKKTNHTSLLWQRSDGKFVQSNYGKSYTLDSANLKDAAKEVYKRNLGLLNNGYIYFVDTKGSYQEFAMKEEAVWGDELDKKDYNNQTVFSNTLAQKSAIQGKVNFSNLGSVSAEVKGTLAYGSETTSKETSYSVGYKKSLKTSLADSSESLGAKLEHKAETLKENGKRFTETKVVVDYTHLHTDGITVDNNNYYAIDGRTLSNQEQISQLKEWFGNEYERVNSKDVLQSQYDWAESYLNDGPCAEEAPMSKEEYLHDYKDNYTNDEGLNYNQLSPMIQANIDSIAENSWEWYLISHRYAGATEIVEERRNNYKDRLDNYEQYRQDYIDDNIKHIENVGLGSVDSHEITSHDTKQLTIFLRKVFGWEKTLLQDGKVTLTNGYKLSGTLGFNDVLSYSKEGNNTKSVFSSFGGDLRLTAEDGLKLDISDKTSLFSMTTGGGIVADFSLKSGTLTPTVSPGVKLNHSALFQTKINDDTSLKAEASGYAVVTRPSVDYGVNGRIQGAKTFKKATTIFGGLNAGLERQRLRIGGFNERTENIVSLGAAIGAKFNNNNSTISLNYNRFDDKLNSTKSKNMFSVTAKFNL